MSISSFTRLVRASAAATRTLNDQLVAEHGVTIEQYEILSRLARAPDRRKSLDEISDPPLVTAANVQNVLRDLEHTHLVDRSDGEVVTLTDKGREKVRAAISSHSEQQGELLGSSG